MLNPPIYINSFTEFKNYFLELAELFRNDLNYSKLWNDLDDPMLLFCWEGIRMGYNLGHFDEDSLLDYIREIYT